jgi:UDP-GlcNAc:undecaprenyl-phosphate/decaprenyl-phosphate GlcNAc-1-phosphate transferase
MKSFASSATVALFSAWALAAACTFCMVRLAARWPWLARSSSNRLHVAPTPVWGGVAIFLSFLAVASVAGLIEGLEPVTLAASALGAFLLGLADDIWKLRPRWKLLGQIACAVVPASFVLHHPISGNPSLDFLIALFWIVGITNAFNLLDNVNGLSAGTAVLVASFQAAFYIHSGEQDRALLAVVFAGSCLGFLVFNFPGGRIFMGDSGSLFTGLWLGALALPHSTTLAKGQLGFVLFPLLLMIVPICDTTLVTFTRLLKGTPISNGGTDHLSHRLIAYGFSRHSAVIVLWIFSIIGGGVGLMAVSVGPPPLLSVAVLLFVGLAIFGTYLTRFDLNSQAGPAVTASPRLRIASWLRISLTVLLDATLIVAAYYTGYLVRFDGQISQADIHLLVSTTAEVLLIKLSVLIAFGAYRPSWDYFGLKDAYRLIGTSAVASLVAIAYFAAVYRFFGFSRIVIAVDFLVLTFVMLVFRFSFRLFDELAPANHRTNILIYGADPAGETALQLVSKHYRFRVVGFVDDDRGKTNLSIHSVPIRGCTQDLARVSQRWRARAVLLTPSASPEEKSRLSLLCHAAGIKLLRLDLAITDLTALTQSNSSEISIMSDAFLSERVEASPKALSKARSA